MGLKYWLARSLRQGNVSGFYTWQSKGVDTRDYLMRKYEDLYDFYIILEDELAYEIYPREQRVEWARSNMTYKYCNGKHKA